MPKSTCLLTSVCLQRLASIISIIEITYSGSDDGDDDEDEEEDDEAAGDSKPYVLMRLCYEPSADSLL